MVAVVVSNVQIDGRREDKVSGRKSPTEQRSSEDEPLQYGDQPRDKGGTETLSCAYVPEDDQNSVESVYGMPKDKYNRAMKNRWTSSSGYLKTHILRANAEMQCGG
ncbi:hypothetical protein M752DRAFT_275513 [Aspergillus phoenicis ATCC 13157]|uniref:Uncharacterized protein n=1 Tax=Aspergillus phoenicis ATCC 13157 TaxID=1353007 RepID=A0A370PMY1_ASPPH|nr:hypothetical protein M752DRAFT_275513 [Aspergillus phoenicis ATCC 13157]